MEVPFVGFNQSYRIHPCFVSDATGQEVSANAARPIHLGRPVILWFACGSATAVTHAKMVTWCASAIPLA